MKDAVEQLDQSTQSTGGPDLALSVIVPVFNQASSIAENIEVIREAVAGGLTAPFELIVVSDGSIDETAERALEVEGIRVIHYDRNLGKGYAVKVGALDARGRYIGYIDADLDLHPEALPEYLEHAERRRLDFAIGSKRHPDSQVLYPSRRRVASWLYQQLVRVLFRLDVRDTQVGLKIFRREVADQVLPLLLVKRYAFDLELLAVGRAFGFDRIEELPIRLDYRFTGSGVRSLAVLHALVDTVAIFYRLRILRYYQRRRALAGTYGWTRPHHRPLVSVITSDATRLGGLDYAELDVVDISSSSEEARHDAAACANGEVLALLEPGARPSGNWLSATAPFLRRSDVGAVVVPKVAPHRGSPRMRAAAAIVESRLGGGSLYFRFTPGNVRFVDDFPDSTIVMRSELYRSLGAGVPVSELAARVAASGHRVLYTPEAVIVSEPPPLFRPHLARARDQGRRRAARIRRRGLRALRPSVLLPAGLVVFLAAAPVALLTQGVVREVWLGWAIGYAVVVMASAAVGAMRFRSLRVGLLTGAGLVGTHLAYTLGFAQRLFTR